MALLETIKQLLPASSQQAAVRQRFLELNRIRLERARGVLKSHQQLFLDLLPLLFHANHPSLPGYLSQSTPCGIDGYQPDELLLKRVRRQLARSYQYQAQSETPARIQSLFLMGSCGSIGQSLDSDLDLWLCHDPALQDNERQQLREKADAISTWASSLGLEVHCFLMDSAEFRRGERAALTVEACGSSQHYLLLDEFYRTGLLLAGHEPTWWFIPPDQESQYDNERERLLKKRRAHLAQTVDFGGVGFIPPGEFIGAGIWQLYKAIHHPYKSLLKLMLTEVYANDYPGGEPLALEYKRQVYAGEVSADKLDPYIITYRRLETYLRSRDELERLELVRRCLYFKVGLKLSQLSASQAQSDWRYPLMRQLASEWGWQEEQLVNLDTRQKWRVRRVQEEHRFLVRELTDSYRFLQNFARRTRSTALINSEEMTVLGRKLYAAFERKAGKVERLNPSIATYLTEGDLSFYFLGNSSDSDERWAVFAGTPTDGKLDTRSSLKKSSSLLHLLCWCHYNGLIAAETRLHMGGHTDRVSESELHRLSDHLGQKLPFRQLLDKLDEHEAFTQPKRPEQILLVVKSGLQGASNSPIPHSGTRDGQGISRIALAVINSWGEILTLRFADRTALIDCLRELLRLNPPALTSEFPRLDIFCYSDRGAQQTTTYIRRQLDELQSCYYQKAHSTSARYILSQDHAFYILQPQEHDVDLLQCNSYTDLIQLLGKKQKQYSPIYLDRHCATNSVLSAILQRRQRNSVQVFIHRRDDFTDVFVSDERGSLFYSPTPYRDFAAMTNALNQLLLSVTPAGDEPEYYLLELKEGRWLSRDLPITETHQPSPDIAVSVNYVRGRCQVHAIEVGGQRFHQQALGTTLYRAVASAIAKSEQERLQRYPCYITNMKLAHADDTTSLQTLDFLHCKQSLEECLNTELLSAESVS